ncbi:hypothetical protein [Streptomyces pseudovenezuelae]|uniref:Uncharacterized protein n=1 Tax=Streptomyces pseudovenezuelae TaxID=67350 RepID=A0ABT6LPC0_9ACTN|nr:hypothetical protein [Streptomyces pseudovenezuelae]
MKLPLFAGVSVLVPTAGLSACDGSSDASADSSGGSSTIDVRLMRDSVSPQFQAANHVVIHRTDLFKAARLDTASIRTHDH